MALVFQRTRDQAKQFESRTADDPASEPAPRTNPGKQAISIVLKHITRKKRKTLLTSLSQSIKHNQLYRSWLPRPKTSAIVWDPSRAGRGKGTSLNCICLTPKPLASSVYVHVPEAPSPSKRAILVMSLFLSQGSFPPQTGDISDFRFSLHDISDVPISLPFQSSRT